MKKIALYCLVAMALAGCGGNKEKEDTYNAQARPDFKEIDSTATAAARRIAAVEITDTFAMQGAVMEARAERSTYAIKGDREGALAYDSVLRAQLSKLNKTLCDTIFANPEPQPEDK